MVEKRHALGRGLGALILPEQKEPAKGADIFIPQGGKTSSRSEAVKKLLAPPPPRAAKASKSKGKADKTKASAEVKTVKPKKNTNAKVASEAENVSRETELLPVPGVTFGEIPVGDIVPNAKQPRSVFDEDDLDELARSIAEVGVLQPVVIRPAGGGKYELIMGERRWRASQLAGLKKIPAIVRRTEDEDLLRDALLENLHRAQLNPLEEAAAYRQLLDDFGCTQDELSRRIARSRPQISNTLRLLRLPGSVQNKVAAQVLSAGHARALLGLDSPEEMEYLANRIVSEGLSVRSTEEIVALGEVKGSVPVKAKTGKRAPRPAPTPAIQALTDRLTDQLDTRVTINVGKKKGRIVIEFVDQDDLSRIIKQMGKRR